MFQKYGWKLSEKPKEKHTYYTEMCAFELCDATNTFLKSMHTVYPGGIQSVFKAALALYIWKINK